MEDGLLSNRGISYVGLEHIGFDDDSWRFIQVERYALPALSPRTEVTSGGQALRLLMAHPKYQSDYQGQQPPVTWFQTPAGMEPGPVPQTVHGRYLLDHLSIDSYEPVDEQTALDTINAFAVDEGEQALSVDRRADIDFRVLRQIHNMPIRYRLRPLPEEAIGEAGWYRALGDYTELVLVDLQTKDLLLITAAQD